MDVRFARFKRISIRLSAKKYARLLQKYAWVFVTILLVLASSWLTWVMSYVADDESGSGEFRSTFHISVDGVDSTESPVYLFMLLHGSSLVAEIGFLETGKPIQLGLSHLSGETPCEIKDGYSLQVSYEKGRSSSMETNENGLDKRIETPITMVTVKPIDPNRSNGFAHLFCKLDIQPFHQTFTDRTLIISSQVPEGIRGIVVDFTGLHGVSNLQLIGGTNEHVRMPDQRFIPSAFVGRISAEWKDNKSEQLRDVGLVFVGSLLGLAASCLLEWLRPFLTEKAKK